MNDDVNYFSDAKARVRFVADPLRYGGRLTDPVYRERFIPTRSPRGDYHGRPYWFASTETFAKFSAMPDSFAVRKKK